MWQGEFFMTEFVKKVIVLDQITNGFGLPGKKVSGVVKVQKNGQKLFAGVYVANFCKSKADFLECVLVVGKKVYHATSDICTFEIKIDSLQQSDEISCLVCAVKKGGGVPFVFASDNPKVVAEDIAKYLECEQITQYEEFVCATDNYFKDDEIDLQVIKQKSICKFKPVELLANYKSTQDKTFFANAKEVLLKIFETYPPCDELNDNMADSFWVKVPFKNQKYFTVGLLQQKGKPRYLAYGVPGRIDRPPDDDGFAFFATQNNQVGFWIICQDANTGFAAEQPYFWV